MDKKLVTTFLAVLTCLLACPVAHTQTGRSFPALQAETLDEKTVQLPQATEGKLAVLALARSKKAEEHLNTWMKPLYQTFIHEHKNDAWLAPAKEDYDDVRLFFIPMFSGLNKMAVNRVRKDMRSSVPDQFQQYIMIYQGKTERYEKRLRMRDKNQPYFFVLDQQGEVTYATSGSYSERKLSEIEEAIERNR